MRDVTDSDDGGVPEAIAETAESADPTDEQLSGEDDPEAIRAVAEGKKPYYRNPRLTNVRNNFALGSYYDAVNVGVGAEQAPPPPPPPPG